MTQQPVKYQQARSVLLYTQLTTLTALNTVTLLLSTGITTLSWVYSKAQGSEAKFGKNI